MARLDKIDLNILALLQKNGKTTNTALAELVHLAPSSCLQRTKRLEQEGFIRAYHAEIDLEKLGDTLTVFTELTLSDHKQQSFAKFEKALKGFEEIVEIHLISGGFDYFLKFICRDMLHYQSTIEAMLNCDLWVEKYFSYVVIKSPLKHRLPSPKMLQEKGPENE